MESIMKWLIWPNGSFFLARFKKIVLMPMQAIKVQRNVHFDWFLSAARKSTESFFCSTKSIVKQMKICLPWLCYKERDSLAKRGDFWGFAPARRLGCELHDLQTDWAGSPSAWAWFVSVCIRICFSVKIDGLCQTRSLTRDKLCNYNFCFSIWLQGKQRWTYALRSLRVHG